MTVTKLQAVKTENVPNPDIIADIQQLLDRAKAGELEGYLVIYADAKGFGLKARLAKHHIWEALGFIEGRVKPVLIGIGNGD